jgi:YegS/Rv2252/BmrU family lipid kinase
VVAQSRKILLIVNPVSGRMKTKAGLFEILDELYRTAPEEIPSETAHEGKTATKAATKPAGAASAMPLPFGNVTATTLGGPLDPDRRVTVAPTMHRGHATQMASSAYREGYDTVICCGGDGTLNETISGILTIPPEHRPRLGYIPAGSTNDFAASIGLPASLRGAARTAVGECETPVDIGVFSPMGDATLPSRYFTYIASFGAFTAASYSTSQVAKNMFGHLAYLVEGVKDIANLRPIHAAFDLSNGLHLEGDYVFGAVSNTTSAGGVVKLPADRVSLSDGQFELLLIHHPKTALDINKIATALWTQNFDGCPLVDLYHTARVKITLQQPLSWSLDGEEAKSGTVIDVRCLPGAVTLRVNE